MNYINLNSLRPNMLTPVECRKETSTVDLSTVYPGDVLDGFGPVKDYATIGVLHHLWACGFRLEYRSIDVGKQPGRARGGRARMAKMTPEERSAYASRMARARWGKADGN